MFRLALIASWIGACGITAAQGADRTVQFNGSAMALTYMIPVSNANYKYSCAVTITNTGSTAQRYKSGSFFGIRWRDMGSYRSLRTTAPEDLNWMRLHSTAQNADTSSDAPCSAAGSLPVGGVCVIRWVNEMIPNTEGWALCAGGLAISDNNAAAPGAVTASGSIFLQQETMVMGGVLSGAHYLSGKALWNVTGVQLSTAMNQSYQIGTGANAFRGDQMNIYCSSACGRFQSDSTATAKARCNEVCGSSGLSQPNQIAPPGFSVPMSTLGWITQSAPHQFGEVQSQTGFKGISGAAVAPGDPAFNLLIANGNFAGGMVTEMTMGPMTSICSANAEYWGAGEIDFTFPSYTSGANGVVVSSNASFAGAPPQRLLCNERHGKEDLYLRTGSTVSFPINGGLPF